MTKLDPTKREIRAGRWRLQVATAVLAAWFLALLGLAWISRT